jgi:hypothetical protein
MIILIATFVVSALSLQNKTDKILSTYAVRREELAARQLQIQDMIISLNSTLQAEMMQQQAIATELGIKINNTITTPANTPATPIASTPTPSPIVVPQPVRRVITRAS